MLLPTPCRPAALVALMLMLATLLATHRAAAAPARARPTASSRGGDLPTPTPTWAAGGAWAPPAPPGMTPAPAAADGDAEGVHLVARQAPRTLVVRSTSTLVRGGVTYRVVRPTTRVVHAAPAPTPTRLAAAPPSRGAIPIGGPTGSSRDVSHAMIAAVNAVRLLNGVMTPVRANTQLAASCVRHAIDMARTSTMTHMGSDGSNPATRAQQAGYNWRYIAENVAAGQTSLVQVMESWMNSAGHRANILSRSVGHMAAAVAANGQGKYFWVQCFGAL